MAVEIQKIYRLGEFELDPNKRLLKREDGTALHLSHKPFQVLLYFIEHRERIVSRQELLDQFWDGRDVYDVTLTKCVGAIRKALGENTETPRFIETRWAEGYRYIGPLEEVEARVSGGTKEKSLKEAGQEESDSVAPPAENLSAPTKNHHHSMAWESTPSERGQRSRRRFVAFAVVAALIIGGALWAFRFFRPAPPESLST